MSELSDDTKCFFQVLNMLSLKSIITSFKIKHSASNQKLLYNHSCFGFAMWHAWKFYSTTEESWTEKDVSNMHSKKEIVMICQLLVKNKHAALRDHKAMPHSDGTSVCDCWHP